MIESSEVFAGGIDVQLRMIFYGQEVKGQGHQALHSLDTKCAVTDERVI